MDQITTPRHDAPACPAYRTGRPAIAIRPFAGGGADWLAALETAGGGAMAQHPGWGDLAVAAGRRVARLELVLGARVIGLVQLTARAGLRLASRGPVWLGPADAGLRRAGLRALAWGGGPLLVTPEHPMAGFGLIPLITARHRAIWDLAPAPDVLRAGLQGKWRNRLGAAERAGLRVRVERDPGWLLRAEAAQRRARGYRGLPAGFVEAWGRAVPGGVLALGVWRDGVPLAGMIFLRHGSWASYHLGWTGAGGRRLGAHPLLLWQGALRLRAAGVRRLDLGDVDGARGAGLMRFKSGTGAEVRPLGATCLVLPGLVPPG
ncbi:GNAT family N-acetyltransferase [Pontitalea aquivivens]|uniref:GNAT family N-acetyltransferase n=1 Tax=Pontitalea aquivivens TaxID=3388663 RepID=UPI0039709B96